MAKATKSKPALPKIGRVSDSRVKKKVIKKALTKGKRSKSESNRQNGGPKAKSKQVKKSQAMVRRRTDMSDDDADTVKKRPSKADLKSVLESLKKEADLITIRKALKYIPFYLKSEGLTKKLMKEVVRHWAESSEKIRVVCLLCLIRIYTKLKDKERKQLVIKNLYNTFLDKCRITKQETMSMIGFMRHSLIELYKLDLNIAMKQAQTSCQQLTVTLKNACTHKNEETYKSVLNWQFANCLILLSSFIIAQDDDSPIRTLTHQVVQLNLGALNLLSSPRYYPYYCHLLENLISLSEATRLFIPVLPQLVELVNKIQLPRERKQTNGSVENEDSKESGSNQNDDDDDDYPSDDTDDDDESVRGSDDESSINESSPDEDDAGSGEEDEMRPNGDIKKNKVVEYNMDLLNHVSLDEAHSLEYNTAVLNRLYELILKYLSSQCHRIAFPELVLLPSVQLRKWTRKSSTPEVQKFKSLLDKVKSDCEKIEESRKSVDFTFNNYPAIDAWEKRMKDSNRLSLPKMVNK